MIEFREYKTGNPIPFSPDTEVTGFLPTMWDEADPRSAIEQADANYSHGGGWNPFEGFTYEGSVLRYPKDPPYPCLAIAKFRDCEIRLYKSAWVAIVAKDGSYEISRMD